MATLRGVVTPLYPPPSYRRPWFYLARLSFLPLDYFMAFSFLSLMSSELWFVALRIFNIFWQIWKNVNNCLNETFTTINFTLEGFLDSCTIFWKLIEVTTIVFFSTRQLQRYVTFGVSCSLVTNLPVLTFFLFNVFFNSLWLDFLFPLALFALAFQSSNCPSSIPIVYIIYSSLSFHRKCRSIKSLFTCY